MLGENQRPFNLVKAVNLARGPKTRNGVNRTISIRQSLENVFSIIKLVI